MPDHDPYAAFRFRDFNLYLFGSLLVQLGLGAQSVAIGWEIYYRTDNTLALGLTGLVQALPMIVLTLPAGLLADVFNRKTLMMISMAGSTATSTGLALTSLYQAPVSVMYLLLFLDACLMTLARPARSAFLPLLVPRRSFENAVKWRISIMQICAVAGPAIGGFLITLGAPVVYIANACTTALYVGFLAMLKVRQAKPETRGMTLENVIVGARFVWRQRLLLTMISLDLFLLSAMFALVIFYIMNLAASDLTAKESLRRLVMSRTALFFIGLAIIAGLLMPLILTVLHQEVSIEATVASTLLAISALLELAGDLSVRHSILKAGLHIPVY